ncbi:hypothetical protein ACU8KH_01553 [Lachancea thermotolerans]
MSALWNLNSYAVYYLILMNQATNMRSDAVAVLCSKALIQQPKPSSN